MQNLIIPRKKHVAYLCGLGTFGRQRCYSYLLQVNDHFHDLGLCDVCGKCATGPCALKLPEPEGRE